MPRGSTSYMEHQLIIFTQYELVIMISPPTFYFHLLSWFLHSFLCEVPATAEEFPVLCVPTLPPFMITPSPSTHKLLCHDLFHPYHSSYWQSPSHSNTLLLPQCITLHSVGQPTLSTECHHSQTTPIIHLHCSLDPTQSHHMLLFGSYQACYMPSRSMRAIYTASCPSQNISSMLIFFKRSGLCTLNSVFLADLAVYYFNISVRTLPRHLPCLTQKVHPYSLPLPLCSGTVTAVVFQLLYLLQVTDPNLYPYHLSLPQPLIITFVYCQT